MKKFTLFGHSFELLPFLAVLLCVISLVCLGNWQLKRLKIKEDFISKIEHNIKNPAIKLTGTHAQPEFYSKIELVGHFQDTNNIFLYGRRSAYPEKDGYYFLSPFQDNSGNIYLVSRAWIPQSAKKASESFRSKSPETIIAFVMPGEEKRFFSLDNDTKNNIWFTLDLQEAHTKLSTNKDFYLMQVGSADLPEGAKPLSANYLSIVRNDHFEYAITWYSLAGFLCIIYFIYNRGKQ